MDAAINWVRKINLANDVWAGVLLRSDSVDGRIEVRYCAFGAGISSIARQSD
jgi:hypothetical protein